jgi:hypothetical protein
MLKPIQGLFVCNNCASTKYGEPCKDCVGRGCNCPCQATPTPSDEIEKKLAEELGFEVRPGYGPNDRQWILWRALVSKELALRKSKSTQHKEWVSAEEPPNHRDKVIVWFTGGGEDDSPIRFGRYVHSLGEWRLEGSNSKWNDRITHWRELPAPPDTSKGDPDAR